METWKDIKDYEGQYQVSDMGNVKSLKKGIILKSKLNRTGYLDVNLYKDKNYSMKSIHRLVAIAFIDNPNNHPQVNHINGIKNDNIVNNLEWCTRSFNLKHAYKLNLRTPLNGIKQPRSRLTEAQIIEIRNLKDTMMYKDIAEIYNIDRSAISRIINNKRWKHI